MAFHVCTGHTACPNLTAEQYLYYREECGHLARYTWLCHVHKPAFTGEAEMPTECPDEQCSVIGPMISVAVTRPSRESLERWLAAPDGGWWQTPF